MGRKKKEQVEIKEEQKFVCCLCGNVSYGYGNDPYPIKNTGKCCDLCNRIVVLRRLGTSIRHLDNSSTTDEE